MSKIPPPLYQKRDSSLELFRILSMLLIIAHHYVVNSGLTTIGSPLIANQFTSKGVFYLVFGAWGKTSINCFILITGYFMCKKKISCKRFLMLLVQIYFYKIIIYLIFLFTGYETFSMKTLIKVVLPFTSVAQDFTGCYLIFFFCIPFLNILVQNMNEVQHRRLLILLLSVYVLFGSVPIFTVIFNYVTWFCIVFLLAAYLRYYPIPLFNRTGFWFVVCIISICLSIVSIVSLAWVGNKLDKFAPYLLLADSNKIFAVTTSLSAFLFFKNLQIPYSSFINAVASTCFGVLLIHANSDTMRRWLWGDLLKNVDTYYSDRYVIHAISSIFIIFVVCSVIDYLRIRFIEKRFFK